MNSKSKKVGSFYTNNMAAELAFTNRNDVLDWWADLTDLRKKYLCKKHSITYSENMYFHEVKEIYDYEN